VDSAIAASEAQTAITAHAGGFPNFPSRKTSQEFSEQHREQPEAKGNPLSAKILSENKSDAETPESEPRMFETYTRLTLRPASVPQNRNGNDRSTEPTKAEARKKNGR